MPVRLQPGARPLPDYELVRQLGAGGFGQVWQACGPGGVDAALKFIQLDARRGEIELRSFEVMKRIRHPNLVSLFGAWRQDDVLILAMELCDRSLHDRLTEALHQNLPGIPVDELLNYLRDAARGIDALNAQRVQHRDIKPMNVLLLNNGVKVADFGLAKVLERSIASHTGALTPAYAAPECFKGETAAQSDQYSLAVTYYQLRTGRLPFEGNFEQVMHGHLLGTADLSRLPAGERAVVARALSKRPEQRWPNCAAFVSALSAAHDERQGRIETVTPRQQTTVVEKRPRLWPVLIAGLFALMLTCGSGVLGIGIAYWPRPQRTTEASTFSPSDEPPLIQPPPSKTYENALGMKFVWLAPGKFRMGNPAQKPVEWDRGDEDETVHGVTLTRGFYMAVHHVTQQQWRTVMNDNPSHFQGDDLPVENVTWRECQDFCKKLKTRDGKPYRLPTEAEWEYACRAGTTTTFSFGESLTSKQANIAGDKTMPVGSYPANAWGLYDMHGNVGQWCADCFGPYPKEEVTDPTGPRLGRYRIVRGGSWSRDAWWSRAACRGHVEPEDRLDDLGCRIVFFPE